MENLSGTIVKGYELRERIGAGGFGAVYKAHQTTIGREVAVKIILPHFASHPDFIRCFEAEAQLIARLEHPYIIPLYDYWRDPDGAYLVMRWLRGGSLRDALQSGPFGLEAAALLLDQITGALASAHRSNVIHRDIKPANILLDEDGNAYLADFGIAKDLGGPTGGQTQGDALVGSPDYLAPEQARSEPVTPRTDIYSLGVVLYEILTGQHPFPGLSGVERLYKHLNDLLPDIATLPDDVRDGINAVIQKATAKNPAQRYQDVLELRLAFREAAGLNRPRTSESAVEMLTLREQAVLQLIADGLSNKEIAEHLFITVGTVKWYVTQIYTKLRVRSRVQAIVRARELNLIASGDSSELSPAATGTVSSVALVEPDNPYKGLRAFQSADYHEFFGREALAQKLVKRLTEADSNGIGVTRAAVGGMDSERAGSRFLAENRFLAVVGPSGSGKSSLVKAGLIPALWRGAIPASGARSGSEKWFVVEMLPGARPLDELEIALVKVAANQSGSLREQLQRDRWGLLRAAQLILPNDGSELALVIDQFEEVFTLVEDENARVHFLNLLCAAVTDPRSRVRVVITLRADFYDRPLRYPEFGDLVRSHMETVLPLTAEGLERAIVKPAEQVGVSFEEGLVAKIVGEVNYQPGALPLLQYALTELFERRQGRLLTHEAYQAIGGTVGALAKRAEDIYLGLDDAGKEAARQMFLRLVTLGEGVEDTRRRTPRSELLAIAADHDLMGEIMDAYAAYRLLTLDNDPSTRTPTVEVAHEAMLREWERLRAWLNESREDIRLQRQLAAMAAEWQRASQDRSFLVGGSRLEQFERWAGETKLALTPAERDYLDASLAERERLRQAEKEQQARESRLERRSVVFLRALVAVLLLATLGAFGLTAAAVNQSQIAQAERDNANAARQESDRQARIAQSRELVGYATANLDGDAELSALLAIRAVNLTYSVDGRALPEAVTVLHQAVQALHPPLRITSHTDGDPLMNGPGFSPDGSEMFLIVNSCYCGPTPESRTEVLDALTGHLLYSIPGTGWGTHWADDRHIMSSWLASGSTMMTTQWDVTSGQGGQQIATFTIPVATEDMNWNDTTADFHYSIVTTTDNVTRLWDMTTGEELFPPRLTSIHINPTPQFSPDGTHLGLLNADGTVSVVDTATWEDVFKTPLNRASDFFRFSPDGQYILTINPGPAITVWNIATGEQQYSVSPPDFPNTLAMSADGSRLAAGMKTGQIIVWDLPSKQQLLTLTGSGPIDWLDLSPDGSHLSALIDPQREGLVWDLRSIKLDQEFLTLVNSGPVPPSQGVSVAYSPDGQRLVAASADDTPIVWDAETGQQLFTLSGHTGAVWAVAWSPDGTRIATGSMDKTVKIWDANTGQALLTLSGHADTVHTLAFSPDGKRLISSGEVADQTARIWDVTTGQQLLVLSGQNGYLRGVAWSPDGRRVVTGDRDATAWVWDATTGEHLLTLSGHLDQVNQVAFSPDGTRIVTSSKDKTARVWDANTGQVLLTLTGHADGVSGVAYSPDGTRIATASGDGTAQLWDAATGDSLLTLYGARSGVARVVFSPDGTRLATENNDGTTRIYVLPIPDLIALAQSRLTRSLTDAECQRYLHVDACPAAK